MLSNFLPELVVFSQVVFIDLVLAGDNAVVVGMAARGLSPDRRRKAIAIGIGMAALLRIVFAAFASMLLGIVGLLLAGGLILLWVCWRMWQDLRGPEDDASNGDAAAGGSTRRSLMRAVWQIIAADLSMSVDNVLAVSGAAHDYPIILALGLAVSVLLMGFAASLLAKLLAHFRWIGYIGLAIIVGVAASMIYRGGLEIMSAGVMHS